MTTEVNLNEATALAELRSLLGDLPTGTLFGSPVERDGVTVIPAARVRFAGGDGKAEKVGEDHGWGHGYVGGAAPLGAFVIADGRVQWVPAVDVQRINLGWQVVAGLGVVAGASALRRALSRRRR